MTWEEFASKIAKMPAKKRKTKVMFIEGYDSAKIWTPELQQNDGNDAITDVDGDCVEPGAFYLR